MTAKFRKLPMLSKRWLLRIALHATTLVIHFAFSRMFCIVLKKIHKIEIT